MGIYSETDLIREVDCEKCGKKYTQRLYEYIGGAKYWSGYCECTPTIRDSTVELLKSQIRILNCDIIKDNWNYEVINSINNELKQLTNKKLFKYSIYNEFRTDGKQNKYIYIVKYPFKKNIANYIGEDIKKFYRETKNISIENLFIEKVLNFSKEDFAHYLSYLCSLREKNR
ncbi:hypothetical protein [Paraclostridium sordellii]|uniref:hypothetical protein n=1 Tax=Paraclostridium sordellii TaxID=1505 RepID=UPI000C782E66|nr:hypothetical protein [Paeniclostridium sordellii]AUN12777.1 hypothetical protein RSJ16_00100 [Paeniclostridium sordellii]